jgi:hypothetical protein
MAGPAIIAGVFMLGGSPDDQVVGLSLALCGALMGLFFHLLVSYARLIVTDQGVSLRQVGYHLDAPWGQVERLIRDTGREGFVLSHPMETRSARRLGAFRSQSIGGLSYYDEERKALLAEGRFIPIEAFGWHLRRGDLEARIGRLAPHLRRNDEGPRRDSG